MDDLERWRIQREVFQKWLAGLDYRKLIDAAEDVKKRMEYEADRIERFQERESFLDFMKRQFE